MAGSGNCYVKSATALGDNQYDVTVQFDIGFDYGGKNLNGAPWTIYCDGYEKASGTGTFNIPSGNGKMQYAKLCETTFTVTMPTSGQARQIYVSAYVNTKVSPPSISAGSNYTLPARTWQWTVSYNANGGWGAPGSQTKNKGSTLKLSSTVPSRDGYTFKGWATSSTGGVVYRRGGEYTSDANVTLYAVWQIITYTVSYNANGGSGAPAAQTKVWGSKLILSSTQPKRTNYNFVGWGTSSSSTTPSYQPGGEYTSNSGATLYAIWQLAYTKPRITNLKADRCKDTTGTLSDEGKYAKVTFNWATDKTVTSIKVLCNGVTTNVSGSGTSGSSSVVVGANALSTEKSYTVSVIVTDSSGTTTQSTTVAPLAYIVDFMAEGKGVAFNKPASKAGVMDIGYIVETDKDIKTKGRLINSTNYGGMWIKARDNALIRKAASADDNFNSIVSMKTSTGSWNIGVFRKAMYVTYDTDANYNAGNNTVTHTFHFGEDGELYGKDGRYVGINTLIKNTPLVGSYGSYLALNGFGGTHDKYFIGVNSLGQVHSGTQLNGATSITKRRLAFADEITPSLLKSSSVSQGTTVQIPSSSCHKYLIMCVVSGGYASCVVPKTFRGSNRVVNYYGGGTSVTFEFKLTSDTSLSVTRIWKEGAWASAGTTMEIWGI